MSRAIYAFLTVSLLISGCTPPAKAPEKALLQAGAAAAPVNPPMGAYIAGDKQDRHFTAIHDSLYAKAVVVSDGKQAAALVTVDCIGLLLPDIRRIQEGASQRITQFSLPPDHIIVSSTHTHSGPDVVGIWGKDYQNSGVDSAYMNFLVQTAIDQIVAAAAKLTPVTVTWGTTSFGEPWVQNICGEEIDRTLTTLRFSDAQAVPVATFTHFACHPTFLDAQFSVVSADFVGGFYREMDRQLGGTNLFLQGPIGGWIQPEDGETSIEKAMNRGKEMALTALNALQKPDTLRQQRVEVKSAPLRLRVDNEGWKQLAAIGTIQREMTDSVTTALSWLAIGEAQFATHPGETAPWFGLETKKLMATDGPKMVLGLSMDALGYILKPAYFENPDLPHAPYLTSMSVGKDAGPDILKGLEKLIPRD
jgi:hypothetical protein